MYAQKSRHSVSILELSNVYCVVVVFTLVSGITPGYDFLTSTWQLLAITVIKTQGTVSCEAKKKQHACTFSGLRDHYS